MRVPYEEAAGTPWLCSRAGGRFSIWRLLYFAWSWRILTELDLEIKTLMIIIGFALIAIVHTRASMDAALFVWHFDCASCICGIIYIGLTHIAHVR